MDQDLSEAYASLFLKCDIALGNSDQHIPQFLEYLNKKHELSNYLLFSQPAHTKKLSQDWWVNIMTLPLLHTRKTWYIHLFLIPFINIWNINCKKIPRTNSYPLDCIEKQVIIIIRKQNKQPNSKTDINFDVPKPIVYFTTYY